jgi:hypothetical protein
MCGGTLLTQAQPHTKAMAFTVDQVIDCTGTVSNTELYTSLVAAEGQEGVFDVASGYPVHPTLEVRPFATCSGILLADRPK